jgi:hypothetical protein
MDEDRLEDLARRCLERYYQATQQENEPNDESEINCIPKLRIWDHIFNDVPLGKEQEAHLADCNLCQVRLAAALEAAQEVLPQLQPN